jgi:cellobiose-specific phosphotransferase system component IIA
LGTAKGELLAAVVACKEVEFDKYKKTLATAESTRAANLKTIEALVAVKGPAAGK